MIFIFFSFFFTASKYEKFPVESDSTQQPLVPDLSWLAKRKNLSEMEEPENLVWFPPA